MELTRKQWFMLSVLVIGSFITILNQTVVTPAIPSIMSEMSIDQATAQWLTTGFTLVNAIMIPITAFLQDRFSTRRLFLVSMGAFGLGSLGAATAASFPLLLTGRLIQAAGAGILMPMTMTVLMVTFPVDKRGSAMGIFGLVNAFAPAIGPTVAGFVIDSFDWHVMFYVITALAVIIIIISVFLLQNRGPVTHGDSHLDPLSLTLSTLGFGFLLFGFSAFSNASTFLFSLVAMAIGAVGVVWFFFRQLKLPQPMLRVEVLKNRRFLVATIIGMLVQGSLLAAGILMPIYVQTLLGNPATVSGLVLMPGAICMGIMNPIAGRLFDKHGPRKLSVIGMGLLTLTTCAFAMLNFDTSLVLLACFYVARMVAMTLVNMPVTTWGMNALDTKLLNHGTSVNNTLRQVAGSLGTAIIISVSTITQNLATPTMGEAPAMLLGINLAFATCAGLCLIGFILTLTMVKDKPGEDRAKDTEGAHKNLLQSIMKTDVFSLPETATVADAMKLFVGSHISAAPIVNDQNEAVGFISDGDILKRLSPQSRSFVDPILMIMNSVNDQRGYDERLEDLMNVKVIEIGARHSIGVSIHDSLPDVCKVLADNHLKKVPVLEDGKIVGIINRSDITQYSMEAYLKGRPSDAVYCEPDDETNPLEMNGSEQANASLQAAKDALSEPKES